MPSSAIDFHTSESPNLEDGHHSRDPPSPWMPNHDAEREECNRKISYQGWRRPILNFTPFWFTLNMGTGVVSILLFNLPYNGRWLYWISVVIFCLNIFIFVLFLVMSILRYLIFPGIWSTMIKHPMESLYLGCFPIALATIVNMTAYICAPAWGNGGAYLAWALWWIDVVLSVAVNLWVPFMMMHKHESEVPTMTAIWLLPIVVTVISSASGSIVASVLPNDQHAIWTLVISYILWGLGMLLTLLTLGIYFLRMTIYDLPPQNDVVSVFVPLGPIGQGAFGIIQLGQMSMERFGRASFIPLAPVAGSVLYVVGIFIALMMWGFGFFWLFIAMASILRGRPPLNFTWWGSIFPLGVYSLSMIKLSSALPSLFFKVLSTISSVLVTLLWIAVSIGTIKCVISGQLFQASCVQEWLRKGRKPRL